MSATDELPKDGHKYRIWSVVEDLVVERYDHLKDEGMRGSFYLVRDWLDKARQRGEILDAEFDYFLEQQEYYRDGVWPRIEKNHGLRRPVVRPPTIVIERGEEYTADRIGDAWSRARGFIFVEKSGMANDLKPLSDHGWLIVSGKGESTREFRERVAGDGTDRPVLAITDADYYGGSIQESLAGHSVRTEHLNLWEKLEHRVQTIGLRQEDADAMDLPRERDPTQSPDEWRTELNALVVLKERRGVGNPMLAYTVARMADEGVPLCPEPYADPDDRVRSSLISAVEDAMADAVGESVDSVLDESDDPPRDQVDADGEGEMHVSLRGRSVLDSVDLSSVAEELEGVAEEKLDNLWWWHQTRYEERVRADAGADDVRAVEAMLP